LHEASREGNAARVAQLLSEGARITGKDDMGYTALHWASLYGHVQGQVMGSVSAV
jgi:ankyrin repeat protein